VDIEKPSKEVMKDFINHNGWRYIEAWIKDRQNDIIGHLLSTPDRCLITRLQIEYKVYQDMKAKIKSMC
jgi:hypothetical protein